MFLRQVKVFLAFAQFITTCFSLPLRQFYPYGVRNGDTALLPNDDGGSGEIPVSILFPYFDRNHGSLYVSTPIPTGLTRKWREMLRDSNITRGAHGHNALLVSLACVSSETHNLQRVFRPVGVVPYMGYIGMCRAKGYGFLAVFVWNRVSISTILVSNRVSFVHSSLELGMFF